MPSAFDFAHLSRIATRHADMYQRATPFPHIVLDAVGDVAVMTEAARLFPGPTAVRWYDYDNPLEKKLAMPHLEQLPAIFQGILGDFNSEPFVRFLERLTGIDNLSADPEYYGGGLHQIVRGGKLDIHADFNVHPHTKLDRRLNVILYLNPEWNESYGGHLELWDAAMTHACRRILPIFNRLVVFNTTDFSYHGHPVPLACPETMSRKSIAVYYYSNGRPAHEMTPPHSTLYQRRPSDPIDDGLDLMRNQRAKGRVEARTNAGAETVPVAVGVTKPPR